MTWARGHSIPQDRPPSRRNRSLMTSTGLTRIRSALAATGSLIKGEPLPPWRSLGTKSAPRTSPITAGHFRCTRLAPNFQVYATVAVLPGLAVSDWVGAGLIVFIDQPDSSITSPNAVRGYHLHFARYPFDPSVVYLQLIHRAPGPVYTVIASARLETFVAGDAIGMARQGSQFTLYMRHAGVWVQVAQAFHTDFYGPVWLAPGIADWTSATPGITRLDDIGGGPIEGTPQPPIGPPPGLIETGRILARMPIGRSHVQYQGIRLWPTPSADLTYRVDGQFLIPELVTPTDVPMLPELYHDMLVCYCGAGVSTSSMAMTRAMLEFQEWTRWLGNLQVYVDNPPDYRPVMGVLTEDGIRWTNLPGGYFPADGWALMALTTYPAITLTSGGGANSKGAYVEIVASTPYDSSRLHVIAGSGNIASVRFLIDLATGAAGSETVVVSNLAIAEGSLNTVIGQGVALDVDIPAGARLSARCQASTGSDQYTIGVLLEDRPLASLTNPVTYGANTVSTRGTQVDPGATAGTKGAYVQFSAQYVGPLGCHRALVQPRFTKPNHRGVSIVAGRCRDGRGGRRSRGHPERARLLQSDR